MVVLYHANFNSFLYNLPVIRRQVSGDPDRPP